MLELSDAMLGLVGKCLKVFLVDFYALKEVFGFLQILKMLEHILQDRFVLVED
jgi:hypothetical protein